MPSEGSSTSEVVNTNTSTSETTNDNFHATAIKNRNIIHFGDVQLADDKFDEPTEIDGIIGAELFAAVMGDNSYASSTGSPVAVQTVFSPDEPVQVYEFNRLAFGVKTSPYLALRTVKQLIKEEGYNYPFAAEVVSTDIYMDDLVCSVPSEEEAHRLYLESVAMCAEGKFDLTKWSSSSLHLLEKIPSDRRLSQPVLFKAETKILGMIWNPEIDSFRFRFPVPGSSCTKRIILSTVARCYDPVGLVTPFILYLKLLIKELWKLKIGWDDMVPNEIFQKWSELKDEWSAFEKIQFSRYMGIVRTSPVMLVAFADASMDGYGAVVYVRTVTENGEITVNLLCAKSKVSLFKVVTIPRLELVAALFLSRGATPFQLMENYLWASGPTWMRLPVADWPIREERVFEESGEDVDSIKCLVSTEDTETHPLYNMVMRLSSYTTILRVTVWVLRFVKILTVKSFITASDMNRAELVLVRIVQGKYFKSDIKLLNLGKEISNRLRKLNPILQNGILMVGGSYAQAANKPAIDIPTLVKELSPLIIKAVIDQMKTINLPPPPSTSTTFRTPFIPPLLDTRQRLTSNEQISESEKRKKLSCSSEDDTPCFASDETTSSYNKIVKKKKGRPRTITP
ncbi:hypothetical protein JTB14_017287 [Gonioctena quinquepunctata]|nr:hypothetical protein JTB14_017287 [Gonioctena quinquepunctata]